MATWGVNQWFHCLPMSKSKNIHDRKRDTSELGIHRFFFFSTASDHYGSCTNQDGAYPLCLFQRDLFCGYTFPVAYWLVRILALASNVGSSRPWVFSAWSSPLSDTGSSCTQHTPTDLQEMLCFIQFKEDFNVFSSSIEKPFRENIDPLHKSPQSSS